MKDNTLVWIVLGIVILFGIAMIPWTGNSGWGACGMMGNWNYGSGGYGLGRLISWLTNVAILIFIALGIFWLIKHLNKK